MKISPHFHLCIAVLLTVATIPAVAGDSKRTAEYILSMHQEFEGKVVTLDVSFVKPVHWKSPIPELAFFHAMTTDRRDHRPGGAILVAIASDGAESFIKRYGLDSGRRGSSDVLKGIFLAAPGNSRQPKGKIWFVDTTGKAVELIKDHKLDVLAQNAEACGPAPRKPGAPPGGPGNGVPSAPQTEPAGEDPTAQFGR